jgi:hypothetical protein
VDAVVEQKVQLITTFVQYASNVWNTLGQEIIQEAASLQQQWGRFFGINPNNQNQSLNTAGTQPGSDSGAGQNHASGSGSGSGAATTAHGDPHPRLENALPLTDSGAGSGSDSGPYSGSATVTGWVWLDNNADGSQDDGEMDYSGATVDLLKSTDNGASWSFCAATTTSSAKQGYNYSLQTGFPVPNNWLYKIQVVFPSYFAATTPSAQSKIDAQGYSYVFALPAGAMQVIPAGLASMNVNTTTDDPAGVTQQNTVTLRDAILTGNNLKPFPAVTFYKNPQTGQQLSGAIPLQIALDPIDQSYNINGPGASTLTVQGDTIDSVFKVSPGVISSISNLSIVNGGGNGDGGGIYNQGTLTLWTDDINNNHVSGGGGGIYNSTGAQLTLYGCTITNKTASIIGGGIANRGRLYISTNSLINYNAAKYGGGVGNTSKAKAAITGGSTANNNTASANGGGIFNSGAVTMSSVSLDGNKASAGGGIYSLGGSITLKRGTVASNQANAYDGAQGGGGGIYVGAGSLALTGRVEVSQNKVSGGNGAGIDIAGGTVNVSGGTIEFNTAQNGYNGGGIYNAAGTLTLQGGVYVGPENSANQGGGMYLANGSTTTFNKVTVAGNVASNGGVGVYQQTNAKIPPPMILTDNDDPGGKPFQGS